MMKVLKLKEIRIQIYWLFYLAAFFLLERLIVPRFIIHCPLDDLIPFNEYFLIFYAAWFVMLPFSFFYFLFRDRKNFLHLSVLMFSGMTICLVLYVLFPNGLNLRPEIIRDNLFSRIALLLYTVDTPTNVCPSIHCSSSAAMALVFMKSKAPSKRLQLGMLALAVMICISTLVTKQHSVIDLVTGVGLTLALEFLDCRLHLFNGIEKHFAS